VNSNAPLQHPIPAQATFVFPFYQSGTKHSPLIEPSLKDAFIYLNRLADTKKYGVGKRSYTYYHNNRPHPLRSI